MKILAVETATDACSAALLVDEGIQERLAVAPREHGALILGMVEALLAAAELSLAGVDAIAFGRGPGSFTGLRIAAGVVQGLAYSAGLGVAPVSTLAGLANGIMQESDRTRVIAALDARMEQVYYAAFIRNAQGLAELQGAEQVCEPQQVGALPEGNWSGVGSGWARYEAALRARLGERVTEVFPDRHPRARDIAQLAVPLVAAGETVAAEAAVPVYLRDTVARKASPG